MAIEMKNVLITGGAGFIGSHITETLVARGCDVTVMDNLASGHIKNIEGLSDQVNFIEGDIRDEALLSRVTKGCDVIFHQAAVVSVTQTVAEPVSSTDVNDMGTLKVLDAARQNSVKRVVLASSSAVYGDDPQLPKVETMTPKPLSPYAVQKLTNEFYANLYFKLYGIETVCLRYFNVYGPRQDPSSPYSGVISIFMKKAADASVPTVYGNGEQTRDFVFVKDVVQANILAATSGDTPGKVFNVGTGITLSIKDLWYDISGLNGYEAHPEYAPARPGDIVHSLASIQEATDRMGFQPSVPLNDGLSQTFNWYQNNT
jgi:UDP-glucose 4-epimerase